MLRIKPGASVEGLKIEAFIAWVVAGDVYAFHGAECWLTSGVDGVHGVNSKHGSGYAVDIRISNIPDSVAAAKIRNKIAENLGPEYDVVLEPDHIHMEFDPD